MELKDGNQYEEEALKAMFRQSASEPSPDLNNKIMKEIMEAREVFEYKPVIGKRAWITMASCFVMLISYLFWLDTGSSFPAISMDQFDFSFLTDWTLPTQTLASWFDLQLFEVPFSFTAAVGVFVVFGLYFIIGFRFRRGYFSK